MTEDLKEIKILNQPTKDQLEIIYDLLGEVFPPHVGRDYFQERLDLDSSYHPATTWFATVDGTIASNVQIFPLPIRVGQANLKIGCMGSVGTLPDFRGMGLALQILQAQTEYMKENDYDMSLLLASKHAFYEKAGWRLIPEVLYSIANPCSSQRITEEEIIPFEPHFLDDLRSIYNEFNHNRTYTLIRDEGYWKDLLTWPEWRKADCLLLRRDNKVIAYGIIERKDNEHIFINELIYFPEAEDSVVDLFLALCKLRPHMKQVYAKFPHDHKLIPYFKEQGATISEQNISMWKMINYASTLHKLQPDLQARLLAHETYSKQELHLELYCGEEKHFLDYKEQQLTISSDANPAYHYDAIHVEERDFISYLIFGYQTSNETDQLSGILEALFPIQNSTFYLTDKF